MHYFQKCFYETNSKWFNLWDFSYSKDLHKLFYVIEIFLWSWIIWLNPAISVLSEISLFFLILVYFEMNTNSNYPFHTYNNYDFEISLIKNKYLGYDICILIRFLITKPLWYLTRTLELLEWVFIYITPTKSNPQTNGAIIPLWIITRIRRASSPCGCFKA